MSWTLRIEFGGLCMFVQRKMPGKKNGLFVLMPIMPGMEHEAVAEFGEGSSKLRVPLNGFEVDLRLAGDGQTESDFRGFGNASHYAETSVAEESLSSTDVKGCLAARIVLPYGSQVTAKGDTAELKVAKSGAVTETLYGRAEVKVEVQDNSKTRIPIASATLFRHPDDSEVSIRMVNVMPNDLDNPGKKPHKKGSRVMHFPAYYRLLEGNCPNGSGPDVLVDCKNPDPNGDCTARFSAAQNRFVDPYNCTIGSGCPPGVISC